MQYFHLKTIIISFTTLLSLSTFSTAVYAQNLQLVAWQNTDYIQKAFNEIALKNEYRDTQLKVLKWLKPIRYQFTYHDMPKNPIVESVFKAHLEHLQLITHHPIKQVTANSKEKANLHIHFTRDEQYGAVIKKVSKTTVKDIERDSNCMGSFKRNKNNEIIDATVVIPTDHVYSRGLLVACAVEETTQLMGLPNDSDWVNPSIANDASRIELLTGLDYLFLKILYDKRLKAGMPFKVNQHVIKQLILELERDGEIERAARNVNQAGLYPLLN
ncbi:MAG: hypothetical protein ISEC1_P0915 [Thiomicrorhabdus sp.]|nr:MAG: hypothetical protein ISEC1_P0915 [Thiomicrorhabdus sp.]